MSIDDKHGADERLLPFERHIVMMALKTHSTQATWLSPSEKPRLIRLNGNWDNPLYHSNSLPPEDHAVSHIGSNLHSSKLGSPSAVRRSGPSVFVVDKKNGQLSSWANHGGGSITFGSKLQSFSTFRSSKLGSSRLGSQFGSLKPARSIDAKEDDGTPGSSDASEPFQHTRNKHGASNSGPLHVLDKNPEDLVNAEEEPHNMDDNTISNLSQSGFVLRYGILFANLRGTPVPLDVAKQHWRLWGHDAAKKWIFEILALPSKWRSGFRKQGAERTSSMARHSSSIFSSASGSRSSSITGRLSQIFLLKEEAQGTFAPTASVYYNLLKWSILMVAAVLLGMFAVPCACETGDGQRWDCTWPQTFGLTCIFSLQLCFLLRFQPIHDRLMMYVEVLTCACNLGIVGSVLASWWSLSFRDLLMEGGEWLFLLQLLSLFIQTVSSWWTIALRVYVWIQITHRASEEEKEERYEQTEMEMNQVDKHSSIEMQQQWPSSAIGRISKEAAHQDRANTAAQQHEEVPQPIRFGTVSQTNNPLTSMRKMFRGLSTAPPPPPPRLEDTERLSEVHVQSTEMEEDQTRTEADFSSQEDTVPTPETKEATRARRVVNPLFESARGEKIISL